MIRLRPAAPEDLPVITTIYHESYAASYGLWSVNHFLVTRDVPNPFGTTLIAARQDVDLGFVRVDRYNSRGGYRHAAEVTLLLRPSLSTHSTGRLLLEGARDFGAEAGYHHVVARIPSQETRLTGMYLSAGFREVGVQHEVGFSDGKWFDMVLYQTLITWKAT